MRNVLGTIVVVCVAGSAGFAADLTPDEKKWLKQCVEGLKSPSDRVMAGAEDAIGRLGTDALPAIVPLLGSLDPADDFDWSGLGRALAGIGAAEAADTLEAAKAKWPRPSQARLSALVTDLRAGKIWPRPPASRPAGGPAVAKGAPAPDDPGVAAQVDALLDEYRGRNSMSSNDPQIRKIVAFGRAAIPGLLRWLVQNGDRHGMGASAAQQALETLVTEADIPAVAAALADGGLDAASCLEKFNTPAARDALLDVVRRGFMSHAVLEGLEPQGSDATVRRALIEWLQTHGAGMSWDVGAVAKFLGERNAAEALPALRPLAKLQGSALPRVAAVMASLGEKDGIGILIRYFESAQDEFRDYERHEAGEALNRIVGEAWYVGRFEPGDRGDGPQGNVPEAARRFREWWVRNEEGLKFDAAARRWRVK